MDMEPIDSTEMSALVPDAGIEHEEKLHAVSARNPVEEEIVAHVATLEMTQPAYVPGVWTDNGQSSCSVARSEKAEKRKKTNM
jgi:hypothetical protein